MLKNAALRLGARGLLLGLISLVLFSACSPDSFLMADEDRERNVQRARDAERVGEFEAAAEHYERALERNPRSASVALGYASLCESQLKRYADAAYLYQKFIKLSPEDPRNEDIRRRINNCFERLATSVPVVVRSETIARDLETTRNENLQLRSWTSNLVVTVTYWSNEWRRASAAAGAAPPGPSSPPPAANPPSGASAGSGNLARNPVGNSASAAAGSTPGTRQRASTAATNPGQVASLADPSSTAARNAGYGVDPKNARTRPPSSASTPNPRTAGPGAAKADNPPAASPPRPAPVTRPVRTSGPVRTHVVNSGDTIESVARRYGVSPAVVAQANPGSQGRRLSAGSLLRIPVTTPSSGTPRP